MRCTALILCRCSQPDRRINVTNFTTESIQEAVKKTTEIVKGFDRKVHTLLVDGKNETFSVDPEYRLSKFDSLARK